MKNIIYLALLGTLFVVGCNDDDGPDITADYDPTPYVLDYDYFPPPMLAADNPLTIAGVELGKKIFHEKMVSKDGSQSCATCHVQIDGFSDKNRFSEGVEGMLGGRQAMPVFNMAWHPPGFFWDGRAKSLREQSLMPIQDPLEMNESLENVVAKLSASREYRNDFVRAFDSEEITSEKIGLAMEQFMLTLVSHDSKFDKFIRGETTLSDAETRGMELFNNEDDPAGIVKGAECFHCHGGFNFMNNQFMNNGLDLEADWKDLGRQKVTMLDEDKAKFKTPSLRNIAVTAPYMHDGRFTNLRDVIQHYNSDVKDSPTVDPLLQFSLNPGLGLTDQDIDDLIAFLNTLTDEVYLNNPEYADPFE
jgi:cytochrome c peroxidase